MRTVLTERQLEVLALRFRDGFKVVEIAAKLEVSQPRVTQIIDESLCELRRHPNIIIDFG